MTLLSLLLAIASLQDDPGDPFVARTVAAGKELLDGAEGARRRELLQALAKYAADRNPGVARHALNAVALYFKEAVAAGRAQDLDVAMDLLAGSLHPDRDTLLRAALDSPMESWVRARALSRLARLGGPAMVPELKRLLRDPLLQSTAAELLGKTLKDSGDPEVLALLKAEGENARDPGDLGAIAFAMRNIGGKRSRDVLGGWIDRLEGWDRTEAAWFVHDVDPIKAVRRLAELGIVDAVTDERLSRILERSEADPARSSCLVTTLDDSGTLVHVNACAFEPLRYDRLIEGFRDHRKKLFSPANARQVREADGRLVVEFDHGGKTWSFSPRDLGTWYDLPPLVDAVNRALADADVKERFVGIRSSIQMGMFALADPDAMAKAARELHLPLEPDPDAGRKGWLRYQEEAARKPK